MTTVSMVVARGLVIVAAMSALACDCGTVESMTFTPPGPGPALPPPPPPVPPTVESIAVGPHFVCVLIESGEVACWGGRMARRLGGGTPVRLGASAQELQRTPAPDAWRDPQAPPGWVPGLDDAEQIAAGGGLACALRSNGRVSCWGEDTSEVLGHGSAETPAASTEISGLEDVAEIKLGSEGACARLRDGTVHCWGRVFDVAEPQPVRFIESATQIDMMRAHVCAVVGDGTVVCWGRDGRSFVNPNFPRPVADLDDAVEVTAGTSHACARRAAGEVACWGRATHGILGAERTGTLSVVPIAVPDLDDVIQLSAGFETTCALRSDGAVSCWGGGYDDREQRIEAARIVDSHHRAACALTVAGRIECWFADAVPYRMTNSVQMPVEALARPEP